MAVLRASCSTWMLPLLLLHLRIFFYQSSCASAVPLLHEFNAMVDKFGRLVQNCPKSCSLGHSTSQTCHCFNISVSQEECHFPRYFIIGLKSLHPSASDTNLNGTISQLLSLLDNIKVSFQTNICSRSPVRMSSKCFHEKLKLAKEQVNSGPDHKNGSLPTVNCE